eukprot:NODE_1270_length_633_cov_679.013699_g1000_i0.p2 GENE.NODE_1270_length_633_cov_679.013699_g1000_i0~~NODE_1270_length_633_cov_679.013699_g1000_i0.p2  ORF type:complete len:180 (+),score=36.11 NODE_1270_length_633_cov_679.013699_g1000_i0:33-572(+)
MGADWQWVNGKFVEITDGLMANKPPPRVGPVIMEFYTKVYNMCGKGTRRKDGPVIRPESEVYKRAQKLYEAFCAQKIIPKMDEAMRHGPEFDEAKATESVTKVWDNYQIVMKWGTRMFNYLDQHYTPAGEVPKLNKMMALVFEKLVLEGHPAMEYPFMIEVIEQVHKATAPPTGQTPLV